VAETWRIVYGRLAHNSPNCRTESWILWRRIAGGLSAGHHRAIAEPFLSSVRALHRRFTTGKGSGDLGVTPQQSVEMWRLLGSLELLSVRVKDDLGNAMVEFMSKKSMKPARQALIWSLGRIGSRTPVYGPLNTVAPADVVGRWLDKLMRVREPTDVDKLAVMQMARRTGDRYRDLDDKQRREVVDWMQGNDAPEHFIELVTEGGTLDSEEQGRVFGEALPQGLRIT